MKSCLAYGTLDVYVVNPAPDRDDLVRIVVEIYDNANNRQWMRQFKDRWKGRLEQLELWMVSYRIEVE